MVQTWISIFTMAQITSMVILAIRWFSIANISWTFVDVFELNDYFLNISRWMLIYVTNSPLQEVLLELIFSNPSLHSQRKFPLSFVHVVVERSQLWVLSSHSSTSLMSVEQSHYNQLINLDIVIIIIYLIISCNYQLIVIIF